MTTITSEISVTINASKSAIWQHIVDPAKMKLWFFGTTVESTWKITEPIVFHGEWQGQSYEDKGSITQFDDERVLEYTHLSSRTEMDDIPENYATIRFELEESANFTKLTITEKNLPSDQAREMSIKIWKMALEKLKTLAEGREVSTS